MTHSLVDQNNWAHAYASTVKSHCPNDLYTSYYMGRTAFVAIASIIMTKSGD
jgi:hypothetical protein